MVGRLTWRDALVAWGLAWGGGLLLALATRSLSRGGWFPSFPTYAAHAWFFAVAMFWFFALHRRYPVGRWRWSELRPWAWSWVAVIVLLVAASPFLGIGGRHQSVLLATQTLLMSLVLVGPTEEFLSRGLVQTGLNNSITWSARFGPFGLRGGTIVASAMFGLAHLANLFASPVHDVLPQIIGATLIGLAIGVLYDRRPNLWGASILHDLIDGLQAVIGYL